jgi:hypothetical protein
MRRAPAPPVPTSSICASTSSYFSSAVLVSSAVRRRPSSSNHALPCVYWCRLDLKAELESSAS